MPEPSKELMVVNPTTGEVLDLHGATTEGLAQAVTDLADKRQAIKDFEEAVESVLLERMTQAASWTLRVGDPRERQWEITSPSPAAGSTAYPADILETELRALVERGTIIESAAAKALKRQVKLTLDVPLHLPLKETSDGLSNITITLGDNELPIASCSYDSSSNKAGIKALEKVPGAKAALDRAKVPVPVGKRRVKVVEKVRDVA
jgi:hypothetical protein